MTVAALYREQIASVLDAVSFGSRGGYTWFGAPIRSIPRGATRTDVVLGLRDQLYAHFYSVGKPRPASIDGHPVDAPDGHFVAALSRANAGQGCWHRDWRVRGTEHDDLVVERDGLTLRVARADCRVTGDAVELRLPKDLPALAPGWYTALGNLDFTTRPRELALRVYVNVTPRGAPALVQALTKTLNRSAVPFRLKVVDHPEGFLRCDSAILTFAADEFLSARPALLRAQSACTGDLGPDVAAFTKTLAPGLGLAEHHCSHESFGMHRCRLLAEGIVAAREERVRSTPGRMRFVERCFIERRIDLQYPYLEPGSHDWYSLR